MTRIAAYWTLGGLLAIVVTAVSAAGLGGALLFVLLSGVLLDRLERVWP